MPRASTEGSFVQPAAWAARRYLDKPVVDLSWAETAFVAGAHEPL